MNTFDDFIEKARDVCSVAGKKTGEVVEISKLKLECVKLNSEIKKLYEKLGSTVYSMMKSSYENQTVIDSLTEEIDENLAELADLNERISDLKNISICNVCGAKNPVDNYYCAKCGSRIKSEFAGYSDMNSEEESYNDAILTKEEAEL